MVGQKPGSALRLALLAAVPFLFAFTPLRPLDNKSKAPASPTGGSQSGQTQIEQDSAAENRQLPQPESAALSVADVRYSTADSRPLTGAEMAALRDSLHWEPESARLRYGGTAVSFLVDVDKDERKLGAIRVRWTRTVAPKSPPSQPALPPVGSFTVQLENGTSCGFLGEAELDDAKGMTIVSSIDLDSWVGLHQPASGHIVEVQGEAELPSANPTIVLKPLEVSTSLSACTTPKHP